MGSLKALAYWHGPNRIHKMALAFQTGCQARSIDCEVRKVSEYRGETADLVWLYGLGEALPVFKGTEGAVRLVGDKGYFAGTGIDKHIRVSVNAQQPDAHLRLRPHSPERFAALGIDTQPVKERGDYILLCGIGRKQCQIQGFHYGQWETQTLEKLRKLTGRRILMREKPKNPPIPGAERSAHASTADAIRGAWAVVCLTGNIGVDAILQGVPVIAEAGPGAVFYKNTLEDIETIKPISLEERRAALSDVAYWHWKRSELSTGEFIDHLRAEGFA